MDSVHLGYITWYSLKHRIWHTNNDTTSGMLCMQHREQVEWGQTWQVCVTLRFQTRCYVSAVTALEQASMLLVLAYIYWRRSLGVGRTLSVALMMKFHLLPSISQRSLQILRCSKFFPPGGCLCTPLFLLLSPDLLIYQHHSFSAKLVAKLAAISQSSFLLLYMPYDVLRLESICCLFYRLWCSPFPPSYQNKNVTIALMGRLFSVLFTNITNHPTGA